MVLWSQVTKHPRWTGHPAAARRPRLFTALVLLAVAVNLIGVAWDFDQHQDALIQTGLPLFDARTFFDPQYAQIPGMLRLGRFETLDVTWVTEGRLHPRLAILALALAAMGATGETTISTAESVAVTFPDFVELMQEIGADIEKTNCAETSANHSQTF